MRKKKVNAIRRNLFTSLPLEVRENSDKGGVTISGYAILFDTPSAVLYADEEEEVREVISPSAITRELLDECDIKMTMFHDRQLILARSKKGKGTLSYDVDEKGVYFEFESPATVDGEKAVELVRRGDIAGCSFAFTTYYNDREYVSMAQSIADGMRQITYTVNRVLGVYDFTLAADPAYPDTNCDARELFRELRAKEREQEEEEPKQEEPIEEEPRPEEPEREDESEEKREKVAGQVREMRRAAQAPIDKSLMFNL